MSAFWMVYIIWLLFLVWLMVCLVVWFVVCCCVCLFVLVLGVLLLFNWGVLNCFLQLCLVFACWLLCLLAWLIACLITYLFIDLLIYCCLFVWICVFAISFKWFWWVNISAHMVCLSRWLPSWLCDVSASAFGFGFWLVARGFDFGLKSINPARQVALHTLCALLVSTLVHFAS